MEIEINSDSPSTPPGSQLKKAREAADLTPDQAAEHLKITVSYIRALEEDDHELLPDRPYVLGYLRAYSRLLSLDTDALLQDYHAYFASVEAPADAKANRQNGDKSSGLSRTAWVLIIVAVLLVWAGAVMLFGGGEESVPSEPAAIEQRTPQTEVAPANEQFDNEIAPAVDAPAALEAETELSGAPAESGSLDDVPASDADILSVEGNTQSEPETVVEPVVTATPEPIAEVSAMDTLLFAFTGECWLEVTDANGDVLVADLFQAGDEFQTEGKAPFDVMMGNVRLVSVSLNGENYDLKPNGFRKTLRTVVQ